MLQNIAGFFAGLLVAMLLIAATELSGFALLGNLPEGLDSSDPQLMQAAVAQLPTLAFVTLLLAYTLGSFGGAFTAAMICGSGRLATACLIGTIIWGSTFFWLLRIPSPLIVWFSLLAIPVATIVGGLLAIIVRPPPISGVLPYDMRKKGMACK